jgi:hypothetical protein
MSDLITPAYYSIASFVEKAYRRGTQNKRFKELDIAMLCVKKPWRVVKRHRALTKSKPLPNLALAKAPLQRIHTAIKYSFEQLSLPWCTQMLAI